MELKPCPVCDGEAEVIKNHRISNVGWGKSYWAYHVGCKECGFYTKEYNTLDYFKAHEKAVEAWNRMRKARADMKSVLISINPKWCELIASGKKTVEVRKTRPKLDTPFKCYIYCTKGKSPSDILCFAEYDNGKYVGDYTANGKVIGEFVCDQFTYIEAGCAFGDKHIYNTAFIEHRMCIPDEELYRYLYKSRENCGGWAWHISDLVIYGRPRELSEFVCRKMLTHPPQSWCYVEVADNG